MIKAITIGVIFLLNLAVYQNTFAGPPEDRRAFIAYYEARFPDIPFIEYANGIYAIDQDARDQWLEIEEFPPYEFAVEQGASLWQEKLPDGKSYSDCFENSKTGIRQSYPEFDRQTGEVITLAKAINLCRKKHGQNILEFGGEKILALSAFMAFESRGEPFDISIPDDDPRALAAYEEEAYRR